MNKRIISSGGNIIAVVVLLFIGYTTFLQLTTRFGNSLEISFLLALLITGGIALFFSALQILKGTDKKFKTRIKIERALLVVSPVLFLLMMQLFIQFWNIQKKANNFDTEFRKAAEYSLRLFNEYDKYTKKRIGNYDGMLERIIRNRNVRNTEYRNCGFTGTGDKVKRENKVNVLHLLLASENYQDLRASAINWVHSNYKASVWNFFMQANITELKDAVTYWHKELVKFSEKKLSDEEFKSYNKVAKFDTNKVLLSEIQRDLDNVRNKFLDSNEESTRGIVFFCITYILLLLPYLVQQRNEKSLYRLLSTEKQGGGFGLEDEPHILEESGTKNNKDNFVFVMDEHDKPNEEDEVMPQRSKRRSRRSNVKENLNNDNIDDSFTL